MFKTNFDKRIAAATADYHDALVTFGCGRTSRIEKDVAIIKEVGWTTYCTADRPYGISRSADMIFYRSSEGVWEVPKDSFWWAVKAKVHTKNVRYSAKRIGLAYWPALLTKTVDAKAYVVAEEVMSWMGLGVYTPNNPSDKSRNASSGGWDSQGYYGLSPYIVDRLWHLSGCKDSPKYRALIRVLAGTAPFKTVFAKGVLNGVLYHVKKSHTLQQTIHLIRGVRWLCNNAVALEIGWEVMGANTVITLGRISTPHRFAALHGHSADTTGVAKIRIRDLNWDAIAQVQAGAVKKSHFIPSTVTSRTSWWSTFNGRITDHMGVWTALNRPSIRESGVPPQTLIGIINSLEKVNSTSTEYLHAAYSLAWLFKKNTVAMDSYLALFSGGYRKVVHDAGQFTPCGKISAVWSGFVVAKPSLIRSVGWFSTVEQRFGVPSTLAEAIAWLEEVSPVGIGWLAGQPPHVQGMYLRWKDQAKQTELVPAPGGKDGLVSGQYTLSQLEAGDMTALYVGELTDCCQHLQNAGSPCAIASYIHPDSAVWVVRKHGEIVAQSWVWRSKSGNTLVMDSVEALHGHRENPVVIDLFLKAAKTVVGTLGVRRVAISNTHYGMTREVIARTETMGMIDTPAMATVVTYSDAGGKLFVLARDKKAVKVKGNLLKDVASLWLDPTRNEDPRGIETGTTCEHCEADVFASADTCWNCGADIAEWV